MDEEPLEPIQMPDLRCREHICVCEVIHGLLRRVLELEQRLEILEGKQGEVDRTDHFVDSDGL